MKNINHQEEKKHILSVSLNHVNKQYQAIQSTLLDLQQQFHLIETLLPNSEHHRTLRAKGNKTTRQLVIEIYNQACLIQEKIKSHQLVLSNNVEFLQKDEIGY